MIYSLAMELVKDFRQVFGAHPALRDVDADALFCQAALQGHECAGDDALALSDKLSRLWELMLDATGDPLLGLKLGMPQPLDGAGLIGHILRVSPDVRGAIENLVRYLPLLSPTAQAGIERLPGGLRVELRLPAGDRPAPLQRYDFVWSATLRTLRAATQRESLRPLLLSYAFASPPPSIMHSYAETFGCEVRFGMPVNAVEFDAAALATPIPAADPAADDWALRLLVELAQSQPVRTRRLNERRKGGARLVIEPDIGFRGRVRQLLVDMLPKGEPLREEVARQLRMSERTLQRRLAEEGTNFTRLVDDIRRELAQQYLAGGQMSLKRLSFQLGFSDPSAFCRACKRWFGQSPKQLQQSGTPQAGERTGNPELLAAWSG
jgi:AraC-like DNA-binding protein